MACSILEEKNTHFWRVVSFCLLVLCSFKRKDTKSHVMKKSCVMSWVVEYLSKYIGSIYYIYV